MFVFACQPPLEFSKSIGNDLGRNRQTFIFFNLVFICSMFTSKQVLITLIVLSFQEKS